MQRKLFPKAKSEDQFKIISDPSTDTSNSVTQVLKILKKNHQNDIPKTYFLKKEKIAQKDHALKFCMEAISTAFMRFLAPNVMPRSANPVIKNDIVTGIVVSKIDHYSSIYETPLLPSHLKVDYSIDENKGFTILELETYLKEIKTNLKNPSENFSSPDIYKQKIISIENNNESHSKTKKKLISITYEEIYNYSIISSLCNSLLVSYILRDDDAHRENLSLFHRIDPGRALLEIVGLFIPYSYADRGDKRWKGEDLKPFIVEIINILLFPLVNDPLYYSCAHSNNNRSLNYKNRFREEDVKVFKMLAKHPVFIFHKNKILLKFILLGSEKYQLLSELYMPKNANHSGKNLIEMITDLMEKRVLAFHEKLILMPEFLKFLTEEGETAFTLINAEIKAGNKKLAEKSFKCDDKDCDMSDHTNCNKFNHEYCEQLIIDTSDTLCEYNALYQKCLANYFAQEIKACNPANIFCSILKYLLSPHEIYDDLDNIYLENEHIFKTVSLCAIFKSQQTSTTNTIRNALLSIPDFRSFIIFNQDFMCSEIASLETNIKKIIKRYNESHKDKHIKYDDEVLSLLKSDCEKEMCNKKTINSNPPRFY